MTKVTEEHREFCATEFTDSNFRVTTSFNSQEKNRGNTREGCTGVFIQHSTNQ